MTLGYFFFISLAKPNTRWTSTGVLGLKLITPTIPVPWSYLSRGPGVNWTYSGGVAACMSLAICPRARYVRFARTAARCSLAVASM